MGLSIATGHVIIVFVAVMCGLLMLKVTKKILGIAFVIGLVVVITKYFGLW